jgi:hypothetical protein
VRFSVVLLASIALLLAVVLGFLLGITFIVHEWWRAWKAQHPLSDSEITEALRPVAVRVHPTPYEVMRNGSTHERD